MHLGNSPKFMTTAKTRQALVRKIGEECKVVMKHENKRITQITGQEHNVYDALRRLTGIDAAAVRPAAQSDEKTSQVNPIDGAEAHSADAKQSANKEGTDERLHSQATDIEDHMWNYIQHKHPEIVAKFAEKFHVELELQSLYDKDGKKYSNLQMSSDDQAKLDEAFEDLANIVQDKFGKVSGFVIEMKKDDADCVKDLVRNEGFIVMPQSFYHITGPNHSLHQVRTKVVQALIDKYGLKKTAESAGPVDSVDDRPASAAQLKIDEKKHDGVDPVDPVVEKPLKPSASEDKEHGVVFSFRSLSGIDVRICRGNYDFDIFGFLLTFYVPMVL